MKTKQILCALLISWLPEVHAQGDVMNASREFLPDRSDTSDMKRVFQASYSLSFLIPHKETTEFQAKRLGDVEPKKRVFKAEMQMLLYAPWWRRDHMFEPQFRFEAKAHPGPGSYVSSSMGFGVSCRSLGASIGGFVGQYYRRVPDEGNFTTRRSRQFDNYPLHGFYLQASDHDASFYFSVTFEEKRTEFGARIASRLGETLELGEANSRLRTLEAVVSSAPFSGAGAGFSIELLPKARMEALWIVPTRDDRVDQARLGSKLTSGVLLSLSCYVN